MDNISIININDSCTDIKGIYNINDYESMDSLMKSVGSKYILFTRSISNLNLKTIYNCEISEKNSDIIMFLDSMDFLPNKVEINYFKEKFLETLFINFENILFSKSLIIKSNIQKEDLNNFLDFNKKIFNKKLIIKLHEENICKKYNYIEFSLSDIFILNKLNDKQKYIYIYNIINKIIDNINNLDKKNTEEILSILKKEICCINKEDFIDFLKVILENKYFDLISGLLLIIIYGSSSQAMLFFNTINNERESIKEIKKISSEYEKLSSILKKQYLNMIIYCDKILSYIKQFLAFMSYISTKPFFINKDLWLIGERSDQAEDNAFIFFKYIRENYPHEKIYYLIDKNSLQYEKVKKLGNVIPIGTFRHTIYLLHAKKLISAYDFFKFLLPNDKNNTFKQYYMRYMNSTRIFLQHGVSMNKANYYNKYINKYDYLLASTNKELNMFVKEYNYHENNIIKIGLPRYDQLIDTSDKNIRKKILFMPTWRNSLVDLHPEDFKNTEYYKAVNNLINDKKLNEFIEDNNIELIVYLHYEMQIFNDCFKFNGKNIYFKTRNDSIVQELLKECDLLITDYSSVGVDFSYLNKPVIFYQFSRHNFHYDINKEEEYTLYSDFGKVITKREDIILNLEKWKDNNFKNFYKVDEDLFFNKDKSKNCQKIYEFIKKIPNKKNRNYSVEILKDNVLKERRVYDKNYNFIERQFYNNKIRTSKLIYKNGLINKQIVYYGSNKIMKSVNFYKDIKISTKYRDVYDKKGNLQVHHEVSKSGILKKKIIYYPNTNKIRSISTYNIENEKLSLIEHFHKNGNIESKLIYTEDGIAKKYYYYLENGIRIREYDYYPSGCVRNKIFYSDDGKDIIKIQTISEINQEIIFEEIFNDSNNI